jgi:hypothetical protein
MIATYPVGGVVWDYAQYALGLEKLGWEVHYLEDTGCQTYDPRVAEYSDDCSYGVAFLAGALERLSGTLGRRWHLRAADGTTYGLPREEFEAIVRGSDLLLNVSGSALLRDTYMAARCKVLIDSDPGWNHFVNFPKWDDRPRWQDSHGYRAHDAFFTFAERFGRADCPLPGLGLPWKTTRPLVISECWSPQPPGKRWSTVMSWDNFRGPIEYQGIRYGTKELEFPMIESLPERVSLPFEIAVGGAHAPREQWRRSGWRVLDSHQISRTAQAYRSYVQRSRGELSVAKNIYVATRCGWFSGRSVCYLAAGRPAVLQDTGFSDVIPTGAGLLAFSTADQAAAAIEEVEADYQWHAGAARRIAMEHFDYRVVLGRLLKELNLPAGTPPHEPTEGSTA